MKACVLALYRACRKLLRGRAITRWPLVESLHRRLAPHLKSEYAEVDGLRFHLDPNDSMELSLHVFEPVEIQLVRKHVREEDVAIDLGANIGYFTATFSRQVGPAGHVYAFEPDPDNFRLLQENTEMNGCANVTLVPAAVSNKTGTVQLYRSEENAGDHRIYDSHDGRSSREVQCHGLDDYFRDFDRPIRFVKIDVQGEEPYVLEGMRSLLARNPDVKMLVEFWPFGLDTRGYGAANLLRLLEELGFAVYEVPKREAELKKIDPARLLRTYTPDNQECTNLFCVREKDLS